MTTKRACFRCSTTLGGDGGHVFGRVVFSFATLEPEREGDRIGKVVRVGGRELVVVGHGAT